MKNNVLLFTPGPLTTSRTTKEAMLSDVGSRDYLFIETVKNIRNGLLELAGVSKEQGYESVIIQGSGTFAVESVLSSVIPEGGQLLVLVNGAYGERMTQIATIHKIKTHVLRFPENEIVNAELVHHYLTDHPEITHVGIIHCETTTGIMNPVAEIGAICEATGKIYIVDAMSSFGGVEMNAKDMRIDFLLSSSNKCIEGVPGFAFVICKSNHLHSSKGNARTLTLDLYAQWEGLDKNGQFRFTPPTLAIMAFQQALNELKVEGGIKARNARYRVNKELLDHGMIQLGFKHYLSPDLQGPIITSFLYPTSPSFDFEKFYALLNDRGLVIYPGKLSKEKAFRIGHIGQIFPNDIQRLLDSVKEVKEMMGF